MASLPADVHGLLGELLAPLQPGDEILPGARWLASSTEAGLRLAVACDGALLHLELAPVDSVQRFAARTALFALSYRTGTGSAGQVVDPRLGPALCAALVPVVQARELAVVAKWQAQIAASREEETPHGHIRHLRGGPLLAQAQWRQTRYYTLSPYIGCLIGCRFCYAQSPLAVLRQLQGSRPQRWGSYVDARVDAAEVLASELACLPPGPIKFSPIVSDPYQAIEQRLALTRACLEVLATRGKPFPTLLLTRSTLVARDVDVLAQLADVRVGVSLPTLDDAVRRHFEPRAASVEARLATMAQLRAAGVSTFAVVQPQWPGPLAALADALAAHVDSVSLGVLESIEDAGPLLAESEMAVASDPSWQQDRLAALREALSERGVAVWDGELPVDLCR